MVFMDDNDFGAGDDTYVSADLLVSRYDFQEIAEEKEEEDDEMLEEEEELEVEVVEEGIEEEEMGEEEEEDMGVEEEEEEEDIEGEENMGKQGMEFAVVENKTSGVEGEAVVEGKHNDIDGDTVLQSGWSAALIETVPTCISAPALSHPQATNIATTQAQGSQLFSLSTPPSSPKVTLMACVKQPESLVSTAGKAKVRQVRYSSRFLDFSAKSVVGRDKRRRCLLAGEEIAAAKAVLEKFKLSLPTTRFDEQLERMLGRELLNEIRSMGTASAVESVHGRLLSFIKEEMVRKPPSTHGLCQCSMACGAFCRRLASLDVFVVENAASYVDSLCAALGTEDSSAPQSTLFDYAMGEIETFRTTRRAVYRQRLDDLTKSIPASSWDVEKITRAVRELSNSGRLLGRRCAYHSVEKRLRDSVGVGDEGVPETVRWHLPLRDPITLGVITVPARGSLCRHKEVFDLVSLVRANQQALLRRGEFVEESNNSRWCFGADDAQPFVCCPVCRSAAPLHSVCVDEYIMEAMRKHTAKGNRVCADDYVLWDDQKRVYEVVERSAAVCQSEEILKDVSEKEVGRPLRVVHIEGHVLYAED